MKKVREEDKVDVKHYCFATISKKIRKFIYDIRVISYIKVFFMKTIAVSEEIHQKISEFGHKNETYNDILERMYNCAIEVEFANFFLNVEGTTNVRDLKW